MIKTLFLHASSNFPENQGKILYVFSLIKVVTKCLVIVALDSQHS